MKIALAGNPNSGKTTMYNALTGKREKVGNWAGVTVDKKESRIKKRLTGGVYATAVDLPGAYSMSPFTAEESITSTYITVEHPDVIINIVDATNLSRSLFFTTQLLELGIPVVVALNKADVNTKKSTVIDAKKLSVMLGCPVIETVSSSKKGIKELLQTAMTVAGKPQKAPYAQAKIDLTESAEVKAEDKRRFDFVNEIVQSVETRGTYTAEMNFQDKIDSIIINKWVGIPIFALVMFAVFWISQAGPGVWIAEGLELPNGTFIPGLVTLIDWLGETVSIWMQGAHPVLTSIIVNGIIEGVGAVIGFLPLVMVMYFLIALLEDCGYMARAAVVLDPIFKRVGLSGKSVIPFIIGTGCAVPGVMACRTIRDERERRTTAMLAPFMPCGAKLPVISLFAGTFFGEARWVGALMYFAGILIIFFGALLVNLVTGYKTRKSFFIMELPEYKAPSVPKAALSMLESGWAYIVKVGTVILVCNFVVKMMQSFTPAFAVAENPSDSILAAVSLPFSYVFAPIVGAAIWQLAAAIITGFIAKENVVATLAVCLGGIENLTLAGGENEGVVSITGVVALSYLMFNLFSPPCFAAIGAMNAELKSKKWLFAGLGLQLSMGYTVAFCVNFFGTLLTDASLGEAWTYVLGWVIVALIVAVYAAMIIRNRKTR